MTLNKIRSQEELKLALACCMSDLGAHGPNPIGMQLAMLLCWVMGSPYPRLEQALEKAKELPAEQIEEWLEIAETLQKKWSSQLSFQQDIMKREPKMG